MKEFLLKYFKSNLSVLLGLCVLLYNLACTVVEAHSSPTHIPTYTGSRCPKANKTITKEPYVFYPASTIVGFVFVGIWFVFILIAKIMYNSSDQYKMNNRFDLVIFKTATKNSLIGPRRIYSNNNINTQNLTAAAASGFDLNILNARASFHQHLHHSSTENSFANNPIVNNNTSFNNKL